MAGDNSPRPEEKVSMRSARRRPMADVSSLIASLRNESPIVHLHTSIVSSLLSVFVCICKGVSVELHHNVGATRLIWRLEGMSSMCQQ